MKYLLLVATAALVAAQSFSDEPSCAIPCLASAVTQVGCQFDDEACQCSSQAAIGSAAVSCLLSSCNSTELAIAQSVGNAICVAYSATASPTAGSSAATATLTPTTTPSSYLSSSSSSPAATGSAKNTTTPSASPSTESSSKTSSSTKTSGASPTASGSASASSSVSTAGAALVQAHTVARAGIFGAFLAAMAAL